LNDPELDIRHVLSPILTYPAKGAIAEIHRIVPRADDHLTIVQPNWLMDEVLGFLSV
jgi:hypothetical protein